jgi:A/G-specific adenine glycosylase
MKFSELLIHYYTNHYRKLPWRDTSNPYYIWLSEVILQQTRVPQGLKYYYKFTEQYPTIQDLAAANEDEVLKLWQGLGYYSRARNMHATAREVVRKYNGEFPSSFIELKKLKGVGDYTAAAIASFAFGEAVPVVDGNVSRVLSRYFGVEEAIDSLAGKKLIRRIAEQELDPLQPALFNQAIMEYGAMVCTSKSPNCATCELRAGCYAHANRKVALLPLKTKKLAPRHRYFYYFVIRFKGRILYKKRGPGDIWQGLHDFPLIEKEKEEPIEEILRSPEFLKIIDHQENYTILSVSDSIRHVLTHQILHVRFIRIELSKALPNPNSSIHEHEFEQMAVPVVIQDFWNTHGI